MSTDEKTLTPAADAPQYTAKDFASDQDVRWCPGCGDYSILAQVQRTMPALGYKKEDVVFISGIGCSSRFPYYMSTYGFHSIHGRALAIASGLKAAHPHLAVWVATGDGDCLSIGGNHFIHACRKNFDINVMMFNNQIYGLTKGQYSPTSLHGQKSRSTPYGAVDHPFNPVLMALGAEATFVARSMDRDQKHMQNVIARGAKHHGISFLDILQNCNIFNDGAFFLYTEKETKADNAIFIEHGKPLVFGKESDKGLKLDGFRPKVVSLSEYSVDDLLVYDEKSKELAFILAHMNDAPGYPMPFGVFLDIERSTCEDDITRQIDTTIGKEGAGDLDKLLHEGNTWKIDTN
ncbi:MAG: 2-oxoacid:ferredoxin oxidoreductase subunit beta [Ignavibacteriae bacterium]|nr:2-oxoacid:ferredoxin oxidoreductase subunit beta [Ignavibacteriota bacterium]